MRWLKRHRTQPLTYDLTEMELNALAQYNSERYHGLIHSDEYTTKMSELQSRFDRASEAMQTTKGMAAS